MGEGTASARVNVAVLLDRDGTLILDKDYLADPEGVELAPGVAAGLKRLAQAGLRLVVVTNQSGVGRGFFRVEDVERVNARLTAVLAKKGVELDAIYVCPHAPDDGCDCRKPAPGLLLRAAADLQLDLPASFVVGDRAPDVGAGRAVGATTIGLGEAAAIADVSASDFGESVSAVLEILASR